MTSSSAYLWGRGEKYPLREREQFRNEGILEPRPKIDPGILSVACLFCVTMMEDGIKTSEADQRVAVLGIAEPPDGLTNA